MAQWVPNCHRICPHWLLFCSMQRHQSCLSCICFVVGSWSSAVMSWCGLNCSLEKLPMLTEIKWIYINEEIANVNGPWKSPQKQPSASSLSLIPSTGLEKYRPAKSRWSIISRTYTERTNEFNEIFIIWLAFKFCSLLVAQPALCS